MVSPNWPVNLDGAASDLLKVCEELVAESDTAWAEDDYGRRYCCFCYEEEEHDADCLIMKAQAAVDKARTIPSLRLVGEADNA